MDNNTGVKITIPANPYLVLINTNQRFCFVNTFLDSWFQVSIATVINFITVTERS